VFEEYLRSDLPAQDRSTQAQLDMAMLLVSAGFETSGNTLATAHYHVLANPPVLRKLRYDLIKAWPDLDKMPSWAELEKVVYLKGIIQEALRLSLAAIGRLSRVNHSNDLEYKGYLIPRGTIVSMSHRFINFDPELFPDPYKFDPERWLQGEKSKTLERSFHPFSKGQRACLGIK
jgi:cytochrome P450